MITHLYTRIIDALFYKNANSNVDALSLSETTLTTFYTLYMDMFAKTLLYSEVPTYFIWNASAKNFNVVRPSVHSLPKQFIIFLHAITFN